MTFGTICHFTSPQNVTGMSFVGIDDLGLFMFNGEDTLMDLLLKESM